MHSSTVNFKEVTEWNWSKWAGKLNVLSCICYFSYCHDQSPDKKLTARRVYCDSQYKKFTPSQWERHRGRVLSGHGAMKPRPLTCEWNWKQKDNTQTIMSSCSQTATVERWAKKGRNDLVRMLCRKLPAHVRAGLGPSLKRASHLLTGRKGELCPAPVSLFLKVKQKSEHDRPQKTSKRPLNQHAQGLIQSCQLT